MDKIKIYIKDPDGVSNAIKDAIESELDKQQIYDEKERKCLLDIREERLSEKLSKWIDCGENLTIEFDLEAATAKVLLRNEH